MLFQIEVYGLLFIMLVFCIILLDSKQNFFSSERFYFNCFEPKGFPRNKSLFWIRKNDIASGTSSANVSLYSIINKFESEFVDFFLVNARVFVYSLRLVLHCKTRRFITLYWWQILHLSEKGIFAFPENWNLFNQLREALSWRAIFPSSD